MNTIERLTKAFRKAFDNDEIEINVNTTADDIEEWDSFTFINLIIAIELEFGIEFKQDEIRKFANVGELIQRLDIKLASQNQV